MRTIIDCQEYKEIIAAHVDGALLSGERLAAQFHLDQCPKCMQMFLWESAVKKTLKRKLSPIPARPGLKERLLDQLGGANREGIFGWSYMSHGLAAAFALLLMVAVPYLFWPGTVQEDILTDTIAQYQKVTQGIANTPQAGSSLTPAARLLDLSPWGYRVLGRQTHRVKGQEGRVFVYQGQGKEYLLAQEFEGTDISPPPGAKTIRASSRDFVSYSQEGVNLIAWKQKNLLCILASTLSKEKLLVLAQQVAMGS
ncbi:MAG: zf-HC2 domain-containing protein [Deltaproteobacteria bacterium]|nr:zf-HC2 domain-containing protein [Deltaproteobacteria bacterium]